jgi:hypothetical protein
MSFFAQHFTQLGIYSFSGALIFCFCGCGAENALEDRENSLNEHSPVKSKKGRHVFDDGSVYDGELVAGKPEGYGERRYLNDDFYVGNFHEGLSHGQGTLRYKSDVNLSRYVGVWQNGKRNGYGSLYLADGSVFVGQWSANVMVHGEFRDVDGTFLSGTWRGDSLERGKMGQVDGSTFTGIFDSEGRYLAGSLHSPNGDHFVGSFLNGIYEGSGSLVKSDGITYVGAFKAGLYSGEGILEDSEGRRYIGSFLQGNPSGEGQQVVSTGVVYSGDWKDGLRHGKGSIEFGDGTSYVGEFRNGLAHDGRYDWGDGRVTRSYQEPDGQWRDRVE